LYFKHLWRLWGRITYTPNRNIDYDSKAFEHSAIISTTGAKGATVLTRAVKLL